MINTSGNTLIIDIRDELSFEYGHIDGAVNIPAEKLDKSDLPKDKKLLICCKSGLISDTEAESSVSLAMTLKTWRVATMAG